MKVSIERDCIEVGDLDESVYFHETVLGLEDRGESPEISEQEA
ncbi:MAG: hypothetical protein NXI30_22355 [bacterium]|nr:hypothetical protein [bacterium]